MSGFDIIVSLIERTWIQCCIAIAGAFFWSHGSGLDMFRLDQQLPLPPYLPKLLS